MVATKARIAEILDKIKTEADPVALNEYRALIRKQVPFFMRTYVAAYLLMQAEQGAGKKRGQEHSRRRPGDREPERRQERPKAEAPRKELPEDEAARLFMSIGRNRRVFPREILGLIMSETSVAKEDVGSIRILDNYSFVQVRKESADEIISALDGKQFRGRTLAVNYARSRRESEEGAAESPAEELPEDDLDLAHEEEDQSDE